MFGIGASVKAIVALIITVIIAAGGWYVMNLKADLAISEENSKRLQEGVREQQALMKQMAEDIASVAKRGGISTYAIKTPDIKPNTTASATPDSSGTLNASVLVHG